MGMLDIIKRWFGGGKKPPAQAASAPRNFMPAPATAPVPGPVAPTTAPAPPTATAAPAASVSAPTAAPPEPGKSASEFVERRVRHSQNAREGTRVLIIDDSPTIVALLKRMLEQNGYTALEATDADTGLFMALSEVPDLIFLDIVLPGMNGFEALRRLRREAVTKPIPVIMISGNELATEQFYAQRIGADDFMKKPFARSEVFARIEKLLDADKVPRRHAVAVKPAGETATSTPATQVGPSAATAVPLSAAKEAAPTDSAQGTASSAPPAAAVAQPAPVAPTAPESTPEPVAASAQVNAPATVASATEPVAEPAAPVAVKVTVPAASMLIESAEAVAASNADAPDAVVATGTSSTPDAQISTEPTSPSADATTAQTLDPVPAVQPLATAAVPPPTATAHSDDAVVSEGSGIDPDAPKVAVEVATSEGVEPLAMTTLAGTLDAPALPPVAPETSRAASGAI